MAQMRLHSLIAHLAIQGLRDMRTNGNIAHYLSSHFVNVSFSLTWSLLTLHLLPAIARIPVICYFCCRYYCFE